MYHAFAPAPGYRFLQEGEKIQAGDVACNDFGDAEFRIGPNHSEIGETWDWSCMPLMRRTEVPST
jgi:hypothetical protein